MIGQRFQFEFKTSSLNSKTSHFDRLRSKKFKFHPPSIHNYLHGLSSFHTHTNLFLLSSRTICLRAHNQEILVSMLVGKIQLIGGWTIESYRYGTSSQPVDVAVLQ
jgi:hypothetical protein